MKALASNATGSPQSGLEEANRALSVINSHGERPLDAALLHLARAKSLAAIGDTNSMLRAIDDADAAASKLLAPNSKIQFDTERSIFFELPWLSMQIILTRRGSTALPCVSVEFHA